jgi:hypothetical protein
VSNTRQPACSCPPKKLDCGGLTDLAAECSHVAVAAGLAQRPARLRGSDIRGPTMLSFPKRAGRLEGEGRQVDRILWGWQANV